MAVAHSPRPVAARRHAGAMKGRQMAWKPNYRLERSERARQKAEKKAARLVSQQEKVAARKDPDAVPPPAEPSEPSKD